MKSIIATGILLGCAQGAIAAPYVNIENNSGYKGSEFEAGLTEVHAGYQFDNGIFVQTGPAFSHVEGGEGATEFSGKAGYTRKLNEDLSVYGEVSFITTDKEFGFEDLNLGTKVGLTYTF